jgi:hypothetical protein
VRPIDPKNNAARTISVRLFGSGMLGGAYSKLKFAIVPLEAHVPGESGSSPAMVNSLAEPMVSAGGNRTTRKQTLATGRLWPTAEVCLGCRVSGRCRSLHPLRGRFLPYVYQFRHADRQRRIAARANRKPDVDEHPLLAGYGYSPSSRMDFQWENLAAMLTHRFTDVKTSMPPS